jgi:protease YdgD
MCAEPKNRNSLKVAGGHDRPLLDQIIRACFEGRNGMVKRAFLLLCGTAALIGSATSEELHPGIIGEDNRQLVEGDGPPWDQIGHVNVQGYRTLLRCTGILVRPNVVLTAAHCVIDRWKGTPISVDRIHFLRKIRGSHFEDHSRAKCLHFLPGLLDFYVGSEVRRQRGLSLQFFARDIVAIILADNLNVGAAELTEEPQMPSGSSIVHASYPANRRYRLSADFQCRLMQSVAHLWLTNCDTHPASSGGPVFVRTTDARLKLAAIMVGVIQHRFAVAVPSSQWIKLSQMSNCP